jgi:hypothetical protein
MVVVVVITFKYGFTMVILWFLLSNEPIIKAGNRENSLIGGDAEAASLSSRE